MNIKINFLSSENIIRLTGIKKDSIIIADQILEGSIRIFPTLSNIEINEIDKLWEIGFKTAQTTYSLYTYALYPVSYLLNAYEVSGEEKYLENAAIISNSFINWVNSDNKNISNKRMGILFSDHAVSNRTQALCYLLVSLDKAGKDIPQNLIDQLINQGKYLSSIDNYTNYNHGLMMDLALLGLVNVLKGKKYSFPSFFQTNLLERLSNSLERDVTEDGVHIENSPGYHFWIMNFYKKIHKPLLDLDKELSEKCEKILNKSLEYAKYITRSDGSVPAMGDTHASLKYIPSKTLSSKFFSKSNIVIFRDLEDKVWASLNSGYKTHVHKHADDGSFNLFYKGQDIFFDPGFLNYENEEDSLLIKSASFHNTVKPIEEEMNIVKQDLSGNIKNIKYESNLSKSKIVGFYCDSEYEASLAIISGYTCGDIERLVVFNKQGYFIIHDQIIEPSKSNNIFEQRFNVNAELNITIDSDSSVSIVDNKSNQLCKVSQFLLPNESNTVIEPTIENTFYARGFNKKEECERIVFSFKKYESIILVELLGYKEETNNNFSSELLFDLINKIKEKVV